MYSKHAKWTIVLDIQAPKELMLEVAKLYKAQYGFEENHISCDFYHSKIFGLCAVIDGQLADIKQYTGFRRGVHDWRWENMEKIL